MCKTTHERTAKHKKTRKQKNTDEQVDLEKEHPDEEKIEGESGQCFHMDFGFVRGCGFKIKQKNTPRIMSIDDLTPILS